MPTFKPTRRELVLIAVTIIVTALGMYAAWQADRAALALRLSQIQVRAKKTEGELTELKIRCELLPPDSATLYQRESGIGLYSYRRIRLGMKAAEVEKIIGLPPGTHRS